MATTDIAKYLSDLRKKYSKPDDKYADYMDPNIQQGIDPNSFIPQSTTPPLDTNKIGDYMDSNIQQGIDMGSYLPPSTTPPLDTNKIGDYMDPNIQAGGDPAGDLPVLSSQTQTSPIIKKQPSLTNTGQEEGVVIPKKKEETGTAIDWSKYFNGESETGGTGDVQQGGDGSGDTDIYSWIDEYYNAARDTHLANLQKTYQESLGLLEEEAGKIGPEYYDLKNKQDARNIINARKLEEMLAHRGYAVGDQVKSSVNMLAQRQGDLASLERQEQGAYDTIEREKTKLAQGLAHEMNIATNENNMKRIESYIDQYNEERQREIQEAGLTGYYEGQPTLDMIKTQLGAEQWQAEMEQRAYEFRENFNLKATEIELDNAIAKAQLALQEGRLELDTYKYAMEQYMTEMANDPNSLENQKKIAEYESLVLNNEKKKKDLASNNDFINNMQSFIEDNFFTTVFDESGFGMSKVFNPDQAPEMRRYISQQVSNGYISQEEGNELLSLYNQEAASAKQIPYTTAHKTGGQVMVQAILNHLPQSEESLPDNISDFDVNAFEADLRASDKTEAFMYLTQMKDEIIDKYGYEYWNRWSSMVQ